MINPDAAGIDGERNPDKLVELKGFKIKSNRSTITKALIGDQKSIPKSYRNYKFEPYLSVRFSLPNVSVIIQGFIVFLKK